MCNELFKKYLLLKLNYILMVTLWIKKCTVVICEDFNIWVVCVSERDPRLERSDSEV